ncbi:hypothetical protein M440DRAFT_1389876 [Trichoderma longibrachiatum ATCC 18648]|uniref:Secreted protein n=1 Tax=Trichoderma longibrachiatum ATCC 18648 TaxID=983965 RepID=A0A2T4C971_TRILO|nr:hypothetical protein M440DRAFT_1389876 [Trichoderma longibrachiatum ATCC 18648]
MCPKLLLLAFRFTGSFTFSVVSSVFQPEGQEALEPKGGEASTFTESRPVYRLMTCGRVRREETIPTRQGTGREEQRRGSEWVPIKQIRYYDETANLPPSIPGCQVW